LIWTQGVQNGGSIVIDYQISYDNATGSNNFIVLASGITTLSYQVVGIVSGATYTFKI
jgi:hypothetical protein